jgi:hypothetical protein
MMLNALCSCLFTTYPPDLRNLNTSRKRKINMNWKIYERKLKWNHREANITREKQKRDLNKYV